MTPERIERMAPGIIRHEEMLLDYLAEIEDPNMSHEDKLASFYFIKNALKLRDFELLQCLFNEHFQLDSDLQNDAYISKLSRIAYGHARPALKIVN